MQKVILFVHNLEFLKPLVIFGISEILYNVDHITGNIAFCLSSFYAIYKLSKENNNNKKNKK